MAETGNSSLLKEEIEEKIKNKEGLDVFKSSSSSMPEVTEKF